MSEKPNWTNIRANFIVDPPEEFISGNNFAAKWQIPKATLHLKATTPNERGRTWWDDREEHQKKVADRVDNALVKDKVEAKLELIRRDEKIMDLVYDKLLFQLESDAFFIENEDVAEFLKIYMKYKESYAKLQEIITDVGGSKKIVYNIVLLIDWLNDEGKEVIKKKYIDEIPINYLNAKGRDFAKDRIDNPSKILEDAVEIDYEEVEDEDDIPS